MIKIYIKEHLDLNSRYCLVTYLKRSVGIELPYDWYYEPKNRKNSRDFYITDKLIKQILNKVMALRIVRVRGISVWRFQHFKHLNTIIDVFKSKGVSLDINIPEPISIVAGYLILPNKLPCIECVQLRAEYKYFIGKNLEKLDGKSVISKKQLLTLIEARKTSKSVGHISTKYNKKLLSYLSFFD